MTHSRKYWHRWEEAGIFVGALIVFVNLFAVLTPYLTGPLFHPVWILIGILMVYVSGMMLGGGERDQAAVDSA